MIKEINDIRRDTPEGRLLFAALCKITTESQTDSEPDEVLEQLNQLAYSMDFMERNLRGNHSEDTTQDKETRVLNMGKMYEKIKFVQGTIDQAIKELHNHEGLACISFNVHMLYSDVDDLDSAYLKITGLTKAEHDKAIISKESERESEKRVHEDAIHHLTEKWIEKGKAVLDGKYHKAWAECVPIRLGDLYRGEELGSCLEIVEKLNMGCDLEHAKMVIEGQGHSGTSFSLVCSMVNEFCDRGNEFVRYVQG